MLAQSWHKGDRMESSICSTLSGLKTTKHTELGVLVREDGAVLIQNAYKPLRWSYGIVQKSGYVNVTIRGKSYRLHRIICEAFLPNPYQLPCVDHINHVRSDNRLVNLRFCSQAQNCDNRTDNAPLADRAHRHQLAFNRWLHW